MVENKRSYFCVRHFSTYRMIVNLIALNKAFRVLILIKNEILVFKVSTIEYTCRVYTNETVKLAIQQFQKNKRS